jgi:hypothetical protein
MPPEAITVAYTVSLISNTNTIASQTYDVIALIILESLMRLDMYNMLPEAISRAYLENPSHQ